MVKVAIYPPNSLILADLIERKGHTPLVLLQKRIQLKVLNMQLLRFHPVFVVGWQLLVR